MPLIRSSFVALGAALAIVLPAKATEPVGKVLSSQGVTSLQRTGATARITGAGDALLAGDVLSTGPGSVAFIELADGSRMSLRPSTVFAVDEFVTEAGKENAALRLFKGGMRAITGFLSKRNPESFKIKTQTATIGIRGTDFDARLCDKDCSEDARKLAAKPVVARIAMVSGNASVLAADGQRRPLAAGGALVSGETVETGPASLAVVVFSDETRITLQADARFKLEDYHYKGAAGESDRSVFRLFKGAMRMVTGLIGKASPQQVRIHTAVATIGIRGTGLDTACGGACAGDAPGGGSEQPGDGLFLHTWSGTTDLTSGSGTVVVPTGGTGFVGAANQPPVALSGIPGFMRNNPAPRPDTIAPQRPDQFGAAQAPAGAGGPEEGAAGLHVWVRDGQVTVDQNGTRIDLGPGQAGFAAPTPGQFPVRFDMPPLFMRSDPTPRPVLGSSLPVGTGGAALVRPISGNPPVCELK